MRKLLAIAVIEFQSLMFINVEHPKFDEEAKIC